MAAGPELEITVLQQTSQTQTSQYHMIPATCGLSESIVTETESNSHQRPGWGDDLLIRRCDVTVRPEQRVLGNSNCTHQRAAREDSEKF